MILSSKTTNGDGTAADITGGTMLILTGTLGPKAYVQVSVSSATGSLVPLCEMRDGSRVQTISAGRSDAAFKVQGTLMGAVSGDGTSVSLEAI